MSSTADRIKGLANEAVGNAKQSLGKMAGDEELQAEGALQELKGKAEQLEADAKDAVKKAAAHVKQAVDKL